MIEVTNNKMFLLLFFVFCFLIVNVNDASAGFRDPFIYPKQLDIKPPKTLDCQDLKNQFKLQIQGILQQGNKKVILINGELLKEGMEWKGLFIEKIDEEGVTFIWYDKDVRCNLYED